VGLEHATVQLLQSGVANTGAAEAIRHGRSSGRRYTTRNLLRIMNRPAGFSSITTIIGFSDQ
jgi:hypothetical protein